ncbi:hypothetical protein [Streptomyces niveus]|uniref:hypothetical protein n=1 Tax=Streptomyces niveus TaxID=193462 RepID=UPI0036627A00
MIRRAVRACRPRQEGRPPWADSTAEAFWRAERYEGGAYTLWLYATDTESWASADHVPGGSEFGVVQSGPRRLWDEVERAFRWWDGHGRPGFESFGLTVGEEGQRAWLGDPGRSWAL